MSIFNCNVVPPKCLRWNESSEIAGNCDVQREQSLQRYCPKKLETENRNKPGRKIGRRRKQGETQVRQIERKDRVH